jgi:hypothetical protein
MGDRVADFIIGILSIIGLFLLLRKIVLWYFKFNKMEENQKEIIKQLRLINGPPVDSLERPKSFVEKS